MAIARTWLAAYLLLCSLLVVASANDYGVYDSSKTQGYDYGSTSNVYKSQPGEMEKPLLEATASIGYGTTPVYQPQTDYGTKPNSYNPQPNQEKEKPIPNETEQPGYNTKPVYQPQPEKPESKQEEKSGYDTKPNSYNPQPNQEKEKPMPEETEKPGYNTKPIYQPQPAEKPESKQEEKSGYGTKLNSYNPQPNQEKEKPMPNKTEKPGYNTKPVYQPQPAEKPESNQEEKSGYGTKPNSYNPQPMPNETEKPGYNTKPAYQPQSAEKPESKPEEKSGYDTKPKSYNPQPNQEKEKPMPKETEKPDYDTKPNFNKPQPEAQPNYNANPTTDFYKPKPEVLPIGVEGLVLCKSGPKYYPIRGALTRITCLTVDENGYEKTHSVCSGETDEKGYFLARLSPSGLEDVDLLSKLKNCKAFLESSPLEACNVPVDVNKGITGAPLTGFRVLQHSGMKLFSVGPFFFTSEPNPAPNGY